MNIKTIAKNPYGKYLIISEDYPYNKNEEDRANLVIVIWNNEHESYSDSYGNGTLEIRKIEPVFYIKKNIFGFYDENIRLPIHLLPEVLKNPSGKLKWTNNDLTLLSTVV